MHKSKMMFAIGGLLGLALLSGSPAQAQTMSAAGTVSSIHDNMVDINTGNNIVTLPLAGTTFIVNGMSVPYSSLYLGLPVSATSYNNYSYYNNGYYTPGVNDYYYSTPNTTPYYSNGYNETGGYYDINGVYHTYRHHHDSDDWNR